MENVLQQMIDSCGPWASRVSGGRGRAMIERVCDDVFEALVHW